MKSSKFQTTILASSVIGAALLSITALGFSAPAGEMSKLAYTGNLWCISNFIEEEDAKGNKVTLPDPDGRNKMDPRYKGKEDWFRREQVTAETQSEAEKKATRTGLFEKSDKTELRAALDKNDESFVTHHFNTGATHRGPCVGTGSTPQGLWINDAIRKECFNIEPPTTIPEENEVAQKETSTTSSASTDGICTGSKGVPEKWAKIFSAAGKRYNINPAWLATIFAAERGLACGSASSVKVSSASSWPSLNRSWPTSSAGAAGPMQFVPKTWASNKQDGDGDGQKDIQNPYDAIFSAAYLFQHTAKVTGDNPSWASMRRAAISYNAGTKYAKYSDSALPEETKAYLAKVREAFKRYNCP